MGLKCSIVRVLLSVFVFFVFVIRATVSAKLFDIRTYGARGDGKTDNTKAFMNTWKEACQWRGNTRIYVPVGTYIVRELMFQGPCRGSMSFFMEGNLEAPRDPFKITSDPWIAFRYVDNLEVTGGGALDGQGPAAWPFNDCHKNHKCISLPSNIGFQFVRHAKISGIRSINSKNTHFHFFGCDDIEATELTISAPADSPNTDGIKIGSSNGIKISRTNIGTGDDCVAILGGSTNINMSDVFCGPGHGISIGSLGKYREEKDVRGITLRNCTLNRTSDGVRIKTWASSLSSAVASHFTFEDVIIEDVENPIIIDQQYCPYPPCNQHAASHIQIKDVTYTNIRGTSMSRVAVNLNCSPKIPCRNIVMKDINLTHLGVEGPPISKCSNVKGNSYGRQSPPSCL